MGDVHATIAALDEVVNLRTASLDAIEMSSTEDGFRFQGHAAVFGERANMGEFTEEIERGAFRKVLTQQDNIPLTLEHDLTKVFATTSSGTLRLTEDPKGLRVEAEIPDTTAARDLNAMVSKRILGGMSFGFVAGRGNSKVERRSGKPHRLITGFKRLLDVCVTWTPAYAQTSAEFRSLALTGAYGHPIEERPRTPAEIALELDEMAARMRETDRRLAELGLL